MYLGREKNPEENILNVNNDYLCNPPSGIADDFYFSLCTFLCFPNFLQGTQIFFNIINMSFKNQIGKKQTRECSEEGSEPRPWSRTTEMSPPETCSAWSVHPGVAAARPRDSWQVAGASTLNASPPSRGHGLPSMSPDWHRAKASLHTPPGTHAGLPESPPTKFSPHPQSPGTPRKAPLGLGTLRERKRSA